MERALPADERDAAFIPALCDQLDDVYRRFLTANRAAIDDDTRQALERSMEILVAAQAGIRMTWLQARVGRALRQTNEILATYPAPKEIGEATAADPTAAGEPPVVSSPAAGRLRRLRILVAALVLALVAAVIVAVVFYAQLHSTRHDLNSARQQVAVAQRQVAGMQASLAGASLKSASAQSQLHQANAQLARLKAEVAGTQAQLASTARQLSATRSQISTSKGSASGLQQSLAAATAQVQQQANQIQALQLCANNDSVVINDLLGGDSVAAGQALTIANATCQTAAAGG